jgi:hypothetical protein
VQAVIGTAAPGRCVVGGLLTVLGWPAATGMAAVGTRRMMPVREVGEPAPGNDWCSVTRPG